MEKNHNSLVNPLRIDGLAKKALYCAFFCAHYLILIEPALAESGAFQCELNTNHTAEAVTVKYVYDGDTVRLTDNRKVRLIGIDTPELARENKPAQPFAKEAKHALQQLISTSQNKVNLVYGTEKYDRYGRALAHLFHIDGTNIQSELLLNGYAIAYTTPPNSQYSDCYFSKEHMGRKNGKGLWSHSRYEILQANMLNSNTNGFRIIEATVNNVSITENNIWLNFDNKIRAQIRKKDIHFFNLASLKCYIGKKVSIRGWIHPKTDNFYLALRHPSAIKLLNDKQC